MKPSSALLVPIASLLLAVVVPSANAITTANAIMTATLAPVAVDTNGLDEEMDPRTERELRRELREIEREIRMEERRASGKSRGRGGAGSKGRGRGDARLRSLPNGMAVTGFILAISIGYLGVFGFFGGVLGLIFGAIGLQRAKRYPEQYGRRKMAKAAVIIGAIVTGVGLLLLAILVGGNFG